MKYLGVVMFLLVGSVHANPLVLMADGQHLFHVDGFVGNTPIRFIVDTGATGVTIPRKIANQAGEFGSCKWVRHMTANGVIDLCKRQVSSIRIGSFRWTEWPVTITSDESTNVGLLGMDVLRLLRVEFSRGRMTLE